MKTSNIVAASSVVAAGLAAAGVFGWGMGVATHVPSAATTSSPASAVRTVSTLPTHLYLTIVTPTMTGSPVGPAVLPSQASVPAFSEVTVTIINFDDATPLTGYYKRFATAANIHGTVSSQPMDTKNPNAAGTSPAQTYTAVDPNLVSHTFTIPSLGLNVPILARSRTTFSFYTGAAGTFEWHCQDPCGTGPSGWSGAMSTLGYMGGELTVV
ncbi:MAG: cupredoxin domain-containing protein [Candidatus Dormibacteria bacterium]